jgi:hypothetical protein
MAYKGSLDYFAYVCTFDLSFFLLSFFMAVLMRFLSKLAMIGELAAVTAIIEVLTRIGVLGIHFSIKVESL